MKRKHIEVYNDDFLLFVYDMCEKYNIEYRFNYDTQNIQVKIRDNVYNEIDINVLKEQYIRFGKNFFDQKLENIKNLGLNYYNFYKSIYDYFLKIVSNEKSKKIW